MLWGSDPDGLQLLATRIASGADVLTTLADEITTVIGLAAWVGQDADGFCVTWGSSLQPRILATIERLSEFSYRIEQQVTEQFQASSAQSSLSTDIRAHTDSNRLRELSHSTSNPKAEREVHEILARIAPPILDAHASAEPETIGSLRGVPLRMRDHAHRSAIRDYLLSMSFEGDQSELNNRRSLLRKVLSESPTELLVLGFDPTGDGQLIVSVGNPESATNVGILVPGIGIELHGLSSLLADGQRLQNASPDSAVVAWLGYDAPGGTGDVSRWKDLPSAITEDRALDGAKRLQGFMSDMSWSDQQHISVLGHSYGSVVVMHAARGAGLPMVDNVVTLGSPGSSAYNSIADLELAKHQNFFSLAADGDLVAGAYGDLIPGLGHGRGPLWSLNSWDSATAIAATARMPSDPGFGGVRVETDAWAPGINDSRGHSEYYAKDSGGLMSLRAILAGDMPPVRGIQFADIAAYERGLTGEINEQLTKPIETR